VSVPADDTATSFTSTAGNVSSSAAAAAAVERQVNPDSAQVVQLRGKLAKLELQLDQMQLRVSVAESLRDKALQQLPRSHSSCSSRAGELEPHSIAGVGGVVESLRASVEQQQQQGCGSTGDGASAAHALRAPLLPAGLFSPPRDKALGAPALTAAAAAGSGTGLGGLSRSFSGTMTTGSSLASLALPGAGSGVSGAGSFGAAANAAIPTTDEPQNMKLLLTGQVRKLQSENLKYMGQIRELEDTVRRQELQLKQQSLSGAAFSGSSGARTPRAGCSSVSGGSGLFSPRLGAGGSGLFSPRLMGTPVRGPPAAAGEMFGGSSSSSGQAGLGTGLGLHPDAGIPIYGVFGAAGGSPTKGLKSPLGVKAGSLGLAGEGSSSSGNSRLGDGWSSHHMLAAVSEDSTLLREDSRRFGPGGVSAAQQQQQGGSSSSSSRRLLLGASAGGGSRGMRVMASGRLRVAAMTKAQQQRRQSMG
jgi:TolA-binding protein